MSVSSRPIAPGGPSRVIQGFFPGGRPAILQTAPVSATSTRPPAPATIQARPVSVPGPVLSGRPNTGALQPAVRPGQPARPTLPAKPPSGAIQPATLIRPQAPQPILPPAARPATLQPQASNAFALPANFNLKPRGSGHPLPEPILRKMESFFNTSFADVRVHVGHEAPSIGALAFAHGSDLYFAPGQYNPQSLQSQQLLGHELTHVVQQRAGRVRNPLGSGVAVVQDPALEAEADRMGQRAAAAATPIQAKPAVGGPVAAPPRGLSSTPATIAANGAILPARAPAQGSLLSGSKAGLPIQPKTPGPTIPAAAAGSKFVIQRVNWNALTHSANDLYGIDGAAPTKLYGELHAPDPQPIGLYHRTEEVDTSRGTALARPKVKVWEANVRLFNKAIRGPDGLPIPERRVDIPGSIDAVDEGGRQAVIDNLYVGTRQAVAEVGPLNGTGATLGVVGINDCVSFATLLQKLIFQASGNAHVARADVRFDQDNYVDLPVAGIGDFILQRFAAGATSEVHGVTVVAADGTTLVTLEAHVEQNLTKPTFHFYGGTAGFLRQNNSGPEGENQFLAANRVKGHVKPLVSATNYAVDQDSIGHYEPLMASDGLGDKLDGIRGRLNLWLVHEKYRLTADSNLRRSDRDHSVIAALPKGTVITVLDKNRGGNEFSLSGLSFSKRHWWVRHGVTEGWVTAHSLAPAREYTLTKSSNLRGLDHAVIAALPKGAVVRVLDKNRAGNEFSLGTLSSSKRHWWVRHGGNEGWVTADTLT